MIPVFFRKINVVFFHWVNLFIISPEIIIQGAEVAPALVKGTANQIACVTVQMRISGDCAFGVGVKRNFSLISQEISPYFRAFLTKNIVFSVLYISGAIRRSTCPAILVKALLFFTSINVTLWHLASVC